MSSNRILCGLVFAGAVLIAGLRAQEHDPCSYSVLHNGPTWDAQSMSVSPDVLAMAWARDGAYGGLGRSNGRRFHSGGAAVAVASVSYWFKVTHHAVAQCAPVEFESDASLIAEVSTATGGNQQDYALATGFQSIGGSALPPTSMAVAATNSGSPVQNATVAVGFGAVTFNLTIPGVSVTTDTVDHDRRTVTTSGKKAVEEEIITVNCWTKIKVVTNGPFGGNATASVDTTTVKASTRSTCKVHAVEGSFQHSATE